MKRSLTGEVVRLKNTKTIGVKVERWTMHPLYRKLIRSSKLYQVHDEYGKAKLHDRVQIIECRPISKTKRFRIGRIYSSEDHTIKETKELRNRENLRAKRAVWLREYGPYLAYTFKQLLSRAKQLGVKVQASVNTPRIKPQTSVAPQSKGKSRRSLAAARKHNQAGKSGGEE